MNGNDNNANRRANEPVHKTNTERFNEIINNSNNPHRIYKALMSIEPSVKQTNQVCEKSKIVIREIFAGLDVS